MNSKQLLKQIMVSLCFREKSINKLIVFSASFKLLLQQTLSLLRIKKNSIQWLDVLGSQTTFQNLLGNEGYHYFLKLIRYADDEKQALLRTSIFLSNAGLPDFAIKGLDAYCKEVPDSLAIHRYLNTLMYTSPEIYSHQDIYDAHVAWGKTLVSAKRYTSYPNTITEKRRLRIGYTCHFFTNSTSTTLLLPILKAHRKNNVEIFIYSDEDARSTPDEVRSIVGHWRDTRNLDNDQFCEVIRNDKIDILLELNGHCEWNRYKALVRKPAPIQINYYNCSNTCGVPGIDYILTGENVKIEKLQPYYSERIFQKKGVYFATPISSHFPPVSPAPFIQNGYITFGSFNQGHKVSRKQIHVWCEILKKVPNSRFYMKASIFDSSIFRKIFAKHFQDGGIDRSRITLEGSSDYLELLMTYAKIDIGLDTYPYAGGTTTVEATIQGVPVVSLVGERFCSQHGYLNLQPLNHEELLGYTENEFIQKAVELALDKNRIINYRKTLRDDFKKSPRANMELFINELEETYKIMWENYTSEIKKSLAGVKNVETLTDLS